MLRFYIEEAEAHWLHWKAFRAALVAAAVVGTFVVTIGFLA